MRPVKRTIEAMTGTLVILRHGQSEWNLKNLFTGWHDVALTEQGAAEATAAGVTMAEAGLRFDTSHTSLQTRAVVTQNLALDAMDQAWLPVERNWRLNERHYGALQGLDKKQTTELHGSEQVHAWRRGYATPPPPVDIDSPEHPINDPRYAHLPPDVLPASECLKDVVDRIARARGMMQLARDTGITPIARVRHPDPADVWSPVRRSIVAGDALYTVSDTGVMGSALATLEPRGWAAFP